MEAVMVVMTVDERVVKWVELLVDSKAGEKVLEKLVAMTVALWEWLMVDL